MNTFMLVGLALIVCASLAIALLAMAVYFTLRGDDDEDYEAQLGVEAGHREVGDDDA